MKRWLVASFVSFSLYTGYLDTGSAVQAQENYDAQWIWVDGAQPKATPKTVWFRREVRAAEPSTGSVRILADEDFVIWANGTKVGSGKGKKLYRFNLNGIVGRGLNVIAVEAKNSGGQAGLFVDALIRGQGGSKVPVDSGSDWKAIVTKPQGDGWLKPDFDDSKWQKVKVIGPHDKSPWKAIVLKDTYLDRFQVARGFELKRIAEPALTGTLVAITWGNRGRLIASREKGPIISLVDEDKDGLYEKAVEYTSLVKNCQGLCMVFDDLYAAGKGPQGVGLYRLPDNNHDDKADSVHLIYKYKGGMGDHGPHDIVFGPDGWLYNNMGNHAWITDTPQPTTPVRDSYEGHLLQPKFEDANGHASGIKVPGGTIWRFTPDGKKWWCETAGFRNEYDFAFNRNGDMFSFDSDMEWDVGMPWYRPVRVNHCIPGAEFGWRSGCAKWPAHYFDSLPGTVDIGRGSPTGVVFYEHVQFPEKYHDSYIVADWSMGRIMAVHLQPNGASYTGTYEDLIVGNPLNVSDIEIDRDGSMVFCTGGRGTEGSVYRLTYPAGSKNKVPFDDVLTVPQLQSAWAREIVSAEKKKQGGFWGRELTNAAWFGTPRRKIRALTLMSQFGPKPSVELLIRLSKDGDAKVRQFAVWLLGNHTGDAVRAALETALFDGNNTVRRRACEAFVRSGIEPPVAPLLKAMAAEDRFLRFAARIALERVPVKKWKSQVLASKNTHVLITGMLALYRLGEEAFSHNEALKIEARLVRKHLSGYNREQKLQLLRMVELTLLAGGRGPEVGDISNTLLAAFPSGDPAFDSDAARILAVLQSKHAVEKIIAKLEAAKSHKPAIDYALTLRYLKNGWNFDTKRRLLDWYESTEKWEGGNSFGPYIANIVGATLENYRPDDRRKLLREWKTRPFASSLLISNSTAEQVTGFEQIVTSILDDQSKTIDAGMRKKLVSVSIAALGRKASPATQASLRKLYDAHPDHRDQLARQLADYPTQANWPFLIKGVQAGETTTMQLCLRALNKIEPKPKTPDDVRAIILSGLKLGKSGGANAVKLLQAVTCSSHDADDDVAKGIAYYQKWYADTYPDAVAAVLPKEDLEKSKYSYRQLVAFLENDPKGRQGDALRGHKIFTKANCAKCHRFGKEGENVGPDLTSLRRRFQRKEIIESLVYPSQVISDQYRMVKVLTVGGLIHNGMPIPGNQGKDKLVLLLSDATKLEIPKDKIEEQVRSKISVMPVGALKDLTLEEIADLFAFLETSRFSEPTPPSGKAAVGGE